MNQQVTNDPFDTGGQSWPSPSSQSGTFSVIPSGNGARLGAYLLDALLMVVTFFIGWLIWSIVLWHKSTSPGKMMLGLIVVDINSGQPSSVGTMALRELVGKTLFSWVSCGITNVVSAIMILSMEKRQGIWDHIATTMVVKK